MVARLIRAAAEVAHRGNGEVGVNGEVGGAHGAQGPGRCARKVFGDFLFGGKAETVFQFREFAGLDFIEVVIGPKQHEHNLGGERLALVVYSVGGKHHGLYAM